MKENLISRKQVLILSIFETSFSGSTEKITSKVSSFQNPNFRIQSDKNGQNIDFITNRNFMVYLLKHSYLDDFQLKSKENCDYTHY